MKKAWLRILVWGLLSAIMVGAFLFNLSMIHNEFSMMGGWRAYNNTMFTGLAALITAALFVWSIVSARKESQKPEDLSEPTAQEKWEKAHPELTNGSYQEERKKEKHSFGYWVKEFLRLGVLPAALVVGIWLGSYYFILKPLESSPETSVTYSEEQNRYDIQFLHINLVNLPDSVVEEEPISLRGYQVPELPEGFTWIVQELEGRRAQIYDSPTYQNEAGQTIRFEVWRSNSGYSVSLANAAHAEELTVNDCPGVLVEFEDGSLELAWGDLEHTVTLIIRADGVDKETVFRLARGFTYRKE